MISTKAIKPALGILQSGLYGHVTAAAKWSLYAPVHVSLMSVVAAFQSVVVHRAAVAGSHAQEPFLAAHALRSSHGPKGGQGQPDAAEAFLAGGSALAHA